MTDGHLTVRDVPSRVQLLGNGAQTAFPFGFAAIAASDVEVYLGDALQTTGFTTALDAGSEGGTVTFAVAPATGVVVTLRRARPYSRLTDFQEAGAFRAKIVNDELDALAMQIQQLRDTLNRAILLSPTAVGAPNLALPTPVARRALIWNAAANALTETDHDPDEAWDLLASAAEFSAATQQAADDALAAALVAQGLVQQSGASQWAWFSFTLVAGQQDYLLPRDAVNVQLYSGRMIIQPPSEYSITDTLGAAQTLHLTAEVSATFEAGKWLAGETIQGFALGGISGNVLSPGVIFPRHLTPGVINAAALLLDKVVTAAKLADSLDLSGKLAASTLPLSVLAPVDATPDRLLVTAPSTGVPGVFEAGAAGERLVIGTGGMRWLAPVLVTTPIALSGLALAQVLFSTSTIALIHEVEIELYDVSLSGSERLVLRVLTAGPTLVSSGYDGAVTFALDTSNTSGNERVLHADTGGFALWTRGASGSDRVSACGLRLMRASGIDNTWRIAGTLHRPGGVGGTCFVSGEVSPSGPIVGIDLRPSGSNTFSTGEVNFRFRV